MIDSPMSPSDVRCWCTPREADLGLRRIGNSAGLGISVVPSGSVFAIEHRSDSGAILVNQVLASPIDGGIGRILLRAGGASPNNIEAIGPRANIRLGGADDRIVWEGVTSGIRHRVTLRVLPDKTAWLWNVEATNASEVAVPIDSILVQDLGLGVRAFVTNNEAYASQYIDHHIARHARYGTTVMSRQNLAQDGKHPWVMHGCLDGASAFATDAMHLFGPRYRDTDGIGLAFGTRLADRRLQHEAACAAIQSLPITLEPRASASWRFFALYEPNHPAASADGDLTRLDSVAWPDRDDIELTTREVPRSVAQDAPSNEVVPLNGDELAQRYPDRFLEEFNDARLLSFFTPDASHNRHVVLRDKERIVTRRHGALLRSGKAMLPDESTLCATCWMHGVFAAQLTIGNTSFHKLFSVSRDPYNIMRASGLRALRRRNLGSRSKARLADCWCWDIWCCASESSSTKRAQSSMRRAEGSRFVPIRNRFGDSAIPMRPITWLRARRMRSTRSAATSCSTPIARQEAVRMLQSGRCRRKSFASRSWDR